MKLMNIRPYTDNVPSHISWFRDRAHWGSLSPIAPSNPSAPLKFWADNSLVFNNFWAQFGQSSVPYQFLAREAGNGKPKLTPIGSKEFFDTYGSSKSLVETYKEFSFMFPLGVPYLVTKEVPTQEASTVNVEGGTEPALDYPVELKSDTLFLVDPKTGNFGVINYQEFVKFAREVTKNTDPQKIETIKAICAAPAMSATDKIKAIRVVVQDAPQFVTI
jgi:hypothetical protein